jgi:hypothetical protein
MQDYEKLGVFYLGREIDAATRKPAGELLLYESKDLVTHGVCVGMTGSGKTGLCIGLLEEAAIDGIPAIVVDPKGDLGNLLLQFPSLDAASFAPWINEDEARQQGVDPAAFAAQQAELWKSGLAKWDQTPDRIERLRNSADFALYTPGSSAGLPLSIIKSFAAPTGDAAEDRELVRDRINTTATALLSLLGIDAEAVQSREHILVSNILDHAWRDGQDLSIADLIHRIQEPPFARVGVMELEGFYPAKERFELAGSLNNLLASPGFEAWMEGEPLDIKSLLYTPDGRPRISILSIAHLQDSERMFFVSLLLNEVLSWVRTQSGTTSLRALFYMDEIFGYFPPVANPPSKKPLLTLLKQARAFGLGIVLATQNPVDLDYKGLANIGTWWIGRLQTERDKDRLLDGLESASPGGFQRGQMDALLSSLGKRVFLQNNVHDKQPTLFETRWCLSYLRGPLTRGQIKQLMAARKAGQPKTAARPASAIAKAARPVLPAGIPQVFLPVRGTGEVTYQPHVLAVAQVRFTDTKTKVDLAQEIRRLTPVDASAVPVQWGQGEAVELEIGDLEKEPAAEAGFAALPAAAGKEKSYPAWSKDFVNWVYGSYAVELYYSPRLKEVSESGESEGDFRIRITQKLREFRDAERERIRAKYASKYNTLKDRLMRAEQAREREKEQSQGQWINAAVTVGGSVLGAIFGGGRRSVGAAAGKAVSAMGRIRKESADVGRAEDTVEAVQAQLAELDAVVKKEIEAIPEDIANEPLEKLAVKPKKSNITVSLCALAWTPYIDGEKAV